MSENKKINDVGLKKLEHEALEEIAEIVNELIDVEEYAKAGRKPPRARQYRIRIDKLYYVVEKHALTGRELLALAGKTPETNYMISEKMRSGEARKIGYDEKADLTKPGVERFMTPPLDQTDGEQN